MSTVILSVALLPKPDSEGVFGAETCGSTICTSAVRPCNPSASVTAGDKVERSI